MNEQDDRITSEEFREYLLRDLAYIEGVSQGLNEGQGGPIRRTLDNIRRNVKRLYRSKRDET